jgi:hypothetical protein
MSFPFIPSFSVCSGLSSENVPQVIQSAEACGGFFIKPLGGH